MIEFFCQMGYLNGYSEQIIVFSIVLLYTIFSDFLIMSIPFTDAVRKIQEKKLAEN